MSDIMRDLLLEEFKMEAAKTKRMLEALPEDQDAFKPHEKSMALGQLANHTATLAGFAAPIMTHEEVNMGTPEDPRRILRSTTKADRLQGFAEVVAASEAALAAATDESYTAPFTLKRQGTTMFTMSRYLALRNLCLNHMVHHRAQLGTYLRQLDLPVPGLFGPSADEK